MGKGRRACDYVACEPRTYFRSSLLSLLSAGETRAEKTGCSRRLTLRLWSPEFEFHLQFPCSSPSTELSDFRQSARSENERECKQTFKVMTSLPMSSPPISISHGLFRCRYSNSRDVVGSSSSFSLPAAKALRRAFRRLNLLLISVV